MDLATIGKLLTAGLGPAALAGNLFAIRKGKKKNKWIGIAVNALALMAGTALLVCVDTGTVSRSFSIGILLGNVLSLVFLSLGLGMRDADAYRELLWFVRLYYALCLLLCLFAALIMHNMLSYGWDRHGICEWVCSRCGLFLGTIPFFPVAARGKRKGVPTEWKQLNNWDRY